MRWEAVTGTPNVLAGVNSIFTAPLVADPGTKFEYGINADWLGKVIEAASGVTLDVALKEGITGPLGMDETTFLRSSNQAANTTPLHLKGADGHWAPSEMNLVEEPEYWSGGHGLYHAARLHQVPAGAAGWRRGRRCPHPVNDELIDSNPCRITGAGRAKRVHKIRPASIEELATVTAAMPERLQLMVILASWCAMRFGETVELRRGDIDLGDEVIRIRRAAVRTQGGRFAVTTPKSDAGIRDVAIPPHMIPQIEDHLSKYVGAKVHSLCFRMRTANIYSRRRSTGTGTKPAPKPAATICDGTTCGTPAPSWPRRPAPVSPNSWRV